MSARRFALFAALLALLLCLAPGSASAKYRIELIAPAQEPASRQDRQPVSISFADARPADEGGEESALVGKVRTNVGIPLGLWIDGPSVAQVYGGLVHAALEGRGHPVRRDPALPQLEVVLHRSWVDGYQGYTVSIDLELRLLEPSGGRPAWSRRFEATAGGAVLFTPRELQKPYAAALADIVEQVRDALRDPSFAAALDTGGPGAATASRPASSAPSTASSARRSPDKDLNQGPPPLASGSRSRSELRFEEEPTSTSRPVGPPAHVPSVDRPWERVTVVIGATLTANECERYVGWDGWGGRECYGRVLGGMDIVARSPDRFMFRGDFGLGLGLTSDLRLMHEAGGSDHEDMLPEFRMRAGLGWGAALPIPDGEIRLSAGPRFWTWVEDATWVAHYADVHNFELISVGAMWLGPEIRADLDVDLPGGVVRLGARLGLVIGGRLTFLWSDYAVYEDYEFLASLSPATRVTLSPGFAISLPGGADGGAHFEIVPQITTVAFTAEQQADYMAMFGERPDPEPSGRVLFVFGGEFRGPRR